MSFQDEVSRRMPTTIHKQLVHGADLLLEFENLSKSFTQARLNGHSTLPLEFALDSISQDMAVTLQVINLLNDGEQ